MKNTNYKGRLTAIYLAVLATSIAGGKAWAQEEAEAAEELNVAEQEMMVLEQITVVGSRLESGTDSEPVTIISALEIERRGITSMDQLLRQVTSNNSSISSSNAGGINGQLTASRANLFVNFSGGSSANLRGLGASSTLVLVNGRRISGEGIVDGDFADISGIPIETIERVEILTAGASAVYGADAVAGVINIVQKSDYEGFSVTLRGADSSSDANDYRLGMTGGKNWSSGNITVSGSIQNEKSVNTREFGLTTRDYRNRPGGTDRRQFTSERGAFYLNPRGQLSVAPGDVFANNALLLPRGSGPVDEFTDPSTFEAASRNSIGEVLPTSLSPEQDTYGLSIRLNQQIDQGVVDRVFADLFYSKRETETRVEVPRIDIGGSDEGFLQLAAPPPFFDDFSTSGFREDIDYSYRFDQEVAQGILPFDKFNTQGENISGAFGFAGDLSDNWSWESTYNYSLNEDIESAQSVDVIGLLFGEEDFDTFELLAPPINLIRADFTTNPDIQRELLENITRENINSKTELNSLQAFTRGAFLNDREAGPLEVAVGFELRREKVNAESIVIRKFDTQSNRRDFDSERDTNAIFTELTFPVNNLLSINAALRYEDIENTGVSVDAESALAAFRINQLDQFSPISNSTRFQQSDSGYSPRIGLALFPTDGLVLRTTTGRSFRAPNASEVGRDSTVIAQFENSFDPLTGVELDGIEVPLVGGGNPRLESEVANTLNVGFEWTPVSLDSRLTMSLDYYDIDYDDRIDSSNPFLPDSFLDIPLQELAVVRSPDGSVAYIFNGPINVAKQRISGVDATLSYLSEIGAYDVDGSITLNQQTQNDRQISSASAVEDLLGVDQPETRVSAQLTMSRGALSLTGLYQYTGGYEVSDRDPLVENRAVDSFSTFDLRASYVLPASLGFAEGLKISAGAQNVFNEDPPFLNIENGFASQFYDIRRRVIYLELNKTF